MFAGIRPAVVALIAVPTFSLAKSAVTFVVPEGAQKGFVTVESMYGKGKSKFYNRDIACFL